MAISQAIFGVEHPNFAGLLFFMYTMHICCEKTDLKKNFYQNFFQGQSRPTLGGHRDPPIGFRNVLFCRKLRFIVT